MPRLVEDWIDDGAGHVQYICYEVEDDLAEWPQEEAASADEAQAA